MKDYPNLKPFTSDQDRAAAAANGRKGGIASGIKRARMADLRLFAYCYMEQSDKLEQAKKRKRKLQREKRKKALEATAKP